MASIRAAETSAPTVQANPGPAPANDGNIDDCSSGSEDRDDGTHCPDLGEPQVRRHSGRDSRLCSGAVRSELPRRVLILAHGSQLKTVGVCISGRASGIARPPC